MGVEAAVLDRTDESVLQAHEERAGEPEVNRGANADKEVFIPLAEVLYASPTINPYPIEIPDFLAAPHKVDRALQVPETVQQLTDLENTTMAGVHKDVNKGEWFVPASSQSSDWTKATIFDTDDGVWHMERQGDENSTRVSLTHVDVNGNTRTFKAINTGDSEGSKVTYSEVRDGEAIKFVNGSHQVESAKLANEFASLTTDKVILVKNEISRTHEVWAAGAAPRPKIEALLADTPDVPKIKRGDVFTLQAGRELTPPRQNPRYTKAVIAWGGPQASSGAMAKH